MAYNYCRHIRTNGRRCQAPALRDELWCFFHSRLHFRHRNARLPKPVANGIDLPALEDELSIQVAISLVVFALAIGKIDEKRARTLFHGLTLASRNVTNTYAGPSSDDLATAYLATLDGLAVTAPSAPASGRSIPPEPDPLNQLSVESDISRLKQS